MEAPENNRHAKTFGNYHRYESTMTRFGWLIILALIVEDHVARILLAGQKINGVLLVVQLLLNFLLLTVGIYKIRYFSAERKLLDLQFKILKLFEITVMVLFISTMYHSIFFSFVAFLPIAFISLSIGFRKSIPYLGIGWLLQLISCYYEASLFVGIDNEYFSGNPLAALMTISLQYLLFTLFAYVWGVIHNEYATGEEENNMLIERLGDKYIQLEQTKRDMQSHYEKAKQSNQQLEDANRKLTASLAEFYTLQQISQAISSIFDMNELLKFVNDVIIGVMGVYHSTVALCHGPQNKLKVQVSSIFDKKELAIVTDYINSDVLKPSIEEGHSMIDNYVNAEDYPFTQGRKIQSLICVPLLAKGKTLGVVLIEHNIQDAFDTDNVRLLEIIAQQVSIAIENARLYQQMHDLATLDGLTGVYNRLYFQDKFQEEFKKAQENGYDLSLIMFDIDYFKKFNDTYGHMFGDLVLKTISAFIQKKLRKDDIFARYGGEEFVIVLPHTSLTQVAEKAEDFREGIAELTISDRVISASVTISIGVSSFPETAGRPSELIKTADDALYEAKHAGRNCVRMAGARVKVIAN